MMKKFFGHLKTVIKHRNKVMINCFKAGLIWQGLVHDLSKFSPTEFFESVKYFAGDRSPIGLARKDKGYSLAWIHHINKNKHHIEYWYDSFNAEQINMPFKYAAECVCDMIGASQVYNGKNYKPYMVLEFWQRQRPLLQTNERMKKFFDRAYTDLKEFGEKKVLNKKYLKSIYNEIVLENTVKKEFINE